MATAMTGAGAATKPRWSTLRLLKMGHLAILVLDLLLVMAVVVATEAHRAALRTVGGGAEPSIVAAQHIKSAMAGMDADAADELLASPGAAAPAAEAYEDRRQEAAAALISAAEHITAGEAERKSIQSLQVGLGTYERLVQRARDLHETGDGRTVAAYRDAAGVMDGTLLQAANALDQADNDVMEKTYRAESFRSSGSRFAIVFTGVLLLLAMVTVQIMLSQRMHRTFNPLLLTATLLALLLVAHALVAVGNSHRELKVAKEVAFPSLHALWRARATAYGAKSEESRYLLDTAHAAQHEAALQADVRAIWRSPGRLTDAELFAALRERAQMAGLEGYLAGELHNPTLRGEREASLDTLEAWQLYVGTDGQIRKLERTGQHKAAVQLCAGDGPGQANGEFGRFDQALGRTLAIDQQGLDASVSHGLQDMERLELEAGIGAVLIGALVVFGLAPRFREYR